jgi:hypothetical protein
MMKAFLIVGFASLFYMVSCNNKLVPLQRTYQDKPYEFSSTSKEEAWKKIINFFTSKGLTIKSIDKNSGLITTENTSFLNSYTWENKNGSLTNPNAFVVCNKVRAPFTYTRALKPDIITGQWVIRLKEEGARIIITTRLTNATGKVVIDNSASYDQGPEESYNLTVQSTGIFEKTIEEALNK